MMTNTQELFDLIPRLRRFGRILLNSQKQVDTLIQSCLQELLSQEQAGNTPQESDQSVKLFQLFLAALERIEIDAEVEDVQRASSQLAEELFERFTGVDRTIFLLRYVDEFSVNMTAKLLGTSKTKIVEAEHRLHASCTET